jgi:hypothetical protein
MIPRGDRPTHTLFGRDEEWQNPGELNGGPLAQTFDSERVTPDDNGHDCRRRPFFG